MDKPIKLTAEMRRALFLCVAQGEIDQQTATEVKRLLLPPNLFDGIDLGEVIDILQRAYAQEKPL